MNDLQILKGFIKYYYFSDAKIHPKEMAVNKEKITSVLKSFGFTNIHLLLLKDVMLGKYDEKILRSYELEHSHYRQYLRKPISMEELKGLITRYFLSKRSPNYSGADLKELYDVICLLMVRNGYTMEIDDDFLKKFRNGDYDHLNPNEILKKQREENLEKAYQNREEDWESFCEAFYKEFDPYIDIYSVSDEEMVHLVKERLGKDDKNVLR